MIANKYVQFFWASKLFLAVFLLALAVFSIPDSAHALNFTPPPFSDKTFKGKFVNQTIPDPIVIPAGQSKEIGVRIKNIGTAAWKRTGSNFVSVYTVNPNYHKSAFSGSDWLGNDQPAKILETVKTGGVAEVKFKLYAPNKPGTYEEKFYLAAENKTWIQGSYFYLKIKVTETEKTAKNSAASNPVASSNTEGNSTEGVNDEAKKINKEYRANLLAFSARKVSIGGGEKMRFTVRYINNGTATWTTYIWQEAGSRRNGDITLASADPVVFADESWQGTNKIAASETAVLPGQPIEIPFDFRAPKKKGEYIARFQLTANSHTLDGGTLELPVTVTADAPIDYVEPAFNSSRQFLPEPNIRIGLYKAEDAVKFKSSFPYQVWDGPAMIGGLSPEELAELDYSNGQYSLKSVTLDFRTANPIRLVPENASGFFTLTNYSRPVSWKGNANFNSYRGIMELRYSPKSDAAFVINELPLDMYIAGIAETSNGAAMEYIKALLVAARSYAYYHINNGVPAEKRTYDVVATTADQLYLGYNSELQMPRVVQAQQATYGELVTYNHTSVVTPYFGHSDGYTRTWKEVWGGTDKPWLQSVACTYDQGDKMFGHGVGLSAQDAAYRADKDGWTYDQILKYYYTGVDVEKMY